MSCNFHWECCFVNNALLSFVTWWLYFGWIRARFPLAVRLFRGEEFGPFSRCSRKFHLVGSLPKKSGTFRE